MVNVNYLSIGGRAPALVSPQLSPNSPPRGTLGRGDRAQRRSYHESDTALNTAALPHKQIIIAGQQTDTNPIITNSWALPLSHLTQ